MNAKQLQTIDGEKIEAYQCGLCKRIGSDRDYTESCCTCNGCGKHQLHNTMMYSHWCDKCWPIESARKDQAKLDRAKEVEYDGGPVYDGNDYFRDLDEYVDQIGPDNEPDFVFPCAISHPSLDADSIIQNMIENFNVEDSESVRLVGEAEFRAAVDAFNKANESGYQIWDGDESKKIRVKSAPSSTGGEP